MSDGTKQIVVDKEDEYLLSKHNWYLSGGDGGYAQAWINKKAVFLHKYLLNTSQEVDHINRNKLDNRRANLRICTRSQNMANTGNRGGSSRFKGVCWDKQMKKWRCKIVYNYRQIFIGLFDDEHQAALAYDLWAKDLFGEFASTNFKTISYGSN